MQEGYLLLNVYSLIILSILAFVFFKKERMHKVEDNTYGKILVFSSLTVLFGVFSGVNYFDNNGVISANIILSKLYMIGLLGIFLLYFSYTLYISKVIKTNEEKQKIVLTIVYLLLASISLCLPLEMSFVDGRVVASGLSIIFTYSIFGIIYLELIILLCINWKTLKNKKYIPIILFIAQGITLFLLQILLINLNFLTNPFIVLTCLMMYFTIENPDVKMLENMTMLRDQADKANNAKSEFLSSMSHEIRTPLNAIVGFSESLKEDDIPKESMEKVEDIIMASNNLLEIVNGILDISKIEANKLEIVEKEYEIEELWNELVVLTRARIGDKGIDFRVNIDPTIPKVLYGDNTRLKQVILNILTNAVKYTKEGFVDFKVNSVINGDKVKLIVSVEDSGIGIKEENLPRLFAKFDRLSVEKSITIEGTGLGLAITKKLVELMGGKIVVQSVYGKGSKFTLFIDQKIISNEVKHQKETTESNTKVIDIKGAKVLLVDDNELNIKVATTLLKKYNLNIDSCTSGFDCLERINKGKEYDIILLDDMMPKMSGKETLNKLKQINNFNIPVIALTANAIEGMKEEYLKLGFTDYLSKPIEKKELERVLRTYLAKREISNTNTTSTDKTISIMPEEVINALKNNKEETKEELEAKTEREIELPNLKNEEINNDDNNKKGKILIVDDDSLNIKVATKLISNYVGKIDTASSGSECISKIIEDNDYDLILMDDMMPELDGPKTLDNLRDIEGFNIPVILLTASEFDSKVEEKIDEHHFAGYLGKPINKEELIKTLTKYIK